MKQVDEDMLIIKAMVGDDFERMNNLIVEMLFLFVYYVFIETRMLSKGEYYGYSWRLQAKINRPFSWRV